MEWRSLSLLVADQDLIRRRIRGSQYVFKGKNVVLVGHPRIDTSLYTSQIKGNGA